MSHQTVVLDVREHIRSGGAPCSQIMDSAAQLAEGDTLKLLAPFEPTPLYEVLARQGFVHESREIGGGDWEVRFTRKLTASSGRGPAASTAATREDCGCGCSSGEVIELDLRGLEPPQPMVRILEVLASLPDGASLRARTDRLPMHLIDQLEARGFQGESETAPEGGYVTFIHRR